MRGAIPPLPKYVLMARSLVKHRDNFTFTFIMNMICKRGCCLFESTIRREPKIDGHLKGPQASGPVEIQTGYLPNTNGAPTSR